MRAHHAASLVGAASILASVATVSGALVSGTASAASPPKTTTTTVPVRAKADLVIWADADRARILLPFAKKFGKEYGISVAVTADSGNLEGDFTTATEAGKGPDIVVGAHDWIGDLVANGTLAPIAMPAIEQKLFYPPALKALRYQGALWGVPYAIENVALFRHPKLTPTAPTTFQQALSEGQALVKAGKAKYPFCDQVGATGDAYHMEPFYTSGGGYLFGTLKNGDWNPKDVGVGLPGSIRFAKILYKYGEKGTTPVFSTSIGYTQAVGGFASGQCAFLVSGPWAIGSAGGIAPGTFALSPVPGFAGMGPARPFLGVQAFMVSSKAKNAALADQFVLDDVASPAFQKAMFAVEPRPAALESVLKQELATNATARGFYAAGKLGQPMPSIPAMDQIWGPLGQAEANIVAGQNPVKQMTEARAAILKAIAAQK